MAEDSLCTGRRCLHSHLQSHQQATTYGNRVQCHLFDLINQSPGSQRYKNDGVSSQSLPPVFIPYQLQSIPLSVMKNIRTFLLVAVGIVGLAVSGPVALSDTTQNQQHSAERAQVMDKRAPRRPPHVSEGPITLPPFPDDPLPSPVSSLLELNTVKGQARRSFLRVTSCSTATIPAQFELCMTSCKAKKNQTDAACTAWCKKHGSVATAQI
ncbi:hypothetical protein V8E36_001919 [Tilletia maclaganii]